MQALSEKGTALLAKFKKFQKLSLVLYALACRHLYLPEIFC